MESAYAFEASQVALSLRVDLNSGLTASQAKAAQHQHGQNALPEDPPTPLWRLVLDQFQDQLSLILLASAFVSFGLAFFEEDGPSWSSFVDPVVILSILILNAIVGVQQEKSAEESIAALSKYASIDAKVMRNGKLVKMKQAELVPGDIVDLAVGDSVPADCRLFEIFSHSFMVDQSILTGESESVSKDVVPIRGHDIVLQDQTNMVFSGTNITVGHARAIVTLIGSKTAIGGIHKSIVNQISEPTPLKQKLDEFGDMLAKAITVICVLVWLINVKNFSDPVHKGVFRGAIYYFKIAIALAVAAIPEGLAVVITTCLALGTKQMAKRNAIVRNLPSVETLGSTSVICSDKTGTLTTNQMCISNVVITSTGSLAEYHVSGTDFSPKGEVSLNGKVLSKSVESLELIAAVSSLCNDSKLTEEKGVCRYIGEPTEAAFKVLVEKLGHPGRKVTGSANDYYSSVYKRLATYEFTRDRKCMSVVVESNSGEKLLFVKGAIEAILGHSTAVKENSEQTNLSDALKSKIFEKSHEYAGKGLRVMGLAMRKIADENEYKEELVQGSRSLKIESNLTFLGFVAMQDPPRPEVSRSVAALKSAGLRIIMVTGDSPDTAASIARSVGIIDDDSAICTGRELELTSSQEKLEICRKTQVFARVEPIHKSLLVETLQELGEVVAVTGDGVNDAPALKKADIGIAMGSGTDVAKSAADMVLADDNFSTIEAAVEQGRAIYYNTKQFIRYLISSNIGEVVSIFLTVLLGLPEALVPVQLLWVNLVTDGLPATALGFNPVDNEIMIRPPRSADEPLVGRWLLFRYVVIGTYVGAATVFGYVWWFVFYSDGPQIPFSMLSNFHQCDAKFPEIGCQMFSGTEAAHGSTMSLSILVMIEMFNAINSLSESDSLLVFPVWKNMYLVYAVILSIALHLAILYQPFLRSLFSTVALNKQEWIAVIVISAPVIVLDEIFKVADRLWLKSAEKTRKEQELADKKQR